jgi:hypothetical protein
MWKDGETQNSPTGTDDLETRFNGLKYSKCDGLNSKGKRKDVHIEKYADSTELRVWLGLKDPIREATDITFTFFFIGNSRQNTYDSFLAYVGNGKIHYWDTIRKKEAVMVLVDQVKTKEDVYKGSTPYLLAEFKFQNLFGECQTKDITEF